MSHSVGASTWYARPRVSRLRNASCETDCDCLSIVAYVIDQSTERPSVFHICSKAFSSSVVSRLQSSMKFGRDTDTGGLGGVAGGTKSGTYGSDGSQRTP